MAARRRSRSVDLWVLGRHRLLDVGPLKPLVRAEPGSGQTRPRTARDADRRRQVKKPADAGRAGTDLGLSHARPASRTGVDLADAEAHDRAGHCAPASRRHFVRPGRGCAFSTRSKTGRSTCWAEEASPRETIEDPALAGWLFGASWVADHGSWARHFRSGTPRITPVRAWLVPFDAIPEPAMIEESSGDPRDDPGDPRHRRAIGVESARPEEWTISVATDDPAWVIVSQLADPQWTARWIGLDGQGVLTAEILPAFRRGSRPGGWQCIAVPASGRWTLRLEYDARDVAEGAAISTVAWLSLDVGGDFDDDSMRARRSITGPKSDRGLT